MSNDDDAFTVLLPDADHKLFCWMMRPGAAVTKGETVALAVPKSLQSEATTDLTTSTQSSATGSHKRPSKRKRLTAPAIATTESDPKQQQSDASKPSQTVPVIAKADGILHIDSNIGIESLVIGKIEPCAHPTVLDNLCALCGQAMAEQSTNQSINESPDSDDNDVSDNKRTRMTVAGVTVSISQDESQRITQQDTDRLKKQSKLSLVLDLDHTLVHATNDIRARDHLHRGDVRSILLPMMEEPDPRNEQVFMAQHFIKLRPHLKEFFERLHGIYEIGVYTAGTREYAEQVCLLIAREVVGTTYDQSDLLDLRRRIAMAEHALKISQQHPPETLPTINNDVMATEENSEKEASSDDKLNGLKAKDNGDPPKNKRFKVTFGEPPPTVKSDHVTEDHIERLRKELMEAEKLESLAQTMRMKLFGPRLVSRTDVGDLGRDVKCLKRVFPCGGSMAVVVDDREDVWARAKSVIYAERPGEPPENLLLVRPYHWDTFIGFADVNNAAGVDLSRSEGENNHVRRSELDLQLLWTCNILVRLHEEFYSRVQGGKEVTVPQVLAEMRRKVLSDANVVLSRLVPLHQQQRSTDTNQPRHPVIRYVEGLGASCQANVTESTTHVVAGTDGTDKAKDARKVHGCFVVKPSWLTECWWSMTKRSEQHHLWGPPPTAKLPTNPKSQYATGRPLMDSSKDNSSSSSDEDDFAVEFENELMDGES
jgi:RNA polymerase II subunit A-like phosphatase